MLRHDGGVGEVEVMANGEKEVGGGGDAMSTVEGRTEKEMRGRNGKGTA